MPRPRKSRGRKAWWRGYISNLGEMFKMLTVIVGPAVALVLVCKYMNEASALPISNNEQALVLFENQADDAGRVVVRNTENVGAAAARGSATDLSRLPVISPEHWPMLDDFFDRWDAANVLSEEKLRKDARKEVLRSMGSALAPVTRLFGEDFSSPSPLSQELVRDFPDVDNTLLWPLRKDEAGRVLADWTDDALPLIPRRDRGYVWKRLNQVPLEDVEERALTRRRVNFGRNLEDLEDLRTPFTNEVVMSSVERLDDEQPDWLKFSLKGFYNNLAEALNYKSRRRFHNK